MLIHETSAPIALTPKFQKPGQKYEHVVKYSVYIRLMWVD